MTPKVYVAISAIMDALLKSGGIPKSQLNEQQKYSFRGIDDVYAKLAPLLVAHKLVILPQGFAHEIEEYERADGKVSFRSKVGMNYKFVSLEDGSIDTVTVYGEAMDSFDKASNKAHSAAYKLMAIQAFCIPTGDPEQDSEHGQQQEINKRRSAPSQNKSTGCICPNCGSAEAVINNQFGDSDYSCYRKKNGCGIKFNKDGSVLTNAN